MNKRCHCLAIAALCIVGTSALAQGHPVPWLSVDMPYGGCSLNAQQDGTASIHYGAMPRFIRVARGTFDFEQLVKDLLAKSYPSSVGRPIGAPVGGVSLSQRQDLLFIDDEKLVRSLLQRAWKARVPPTTPQEIEDHDWVSKACSLP
jgi:hypothetical protein